MDSKFILKNREIPTSVEPIIDSLSTEGDNVLFVIVGDLSLKGKYAESALIFAENSVVSYNGEPGGEKRYFYTDMKDVVARVGVPSLDRISPSREAGSEEQAYSVTQ